MCGLSLAWVTSENSTMLLESDSSWDSSVTGPYPLSASPLCCPVSGVDCPWPWIHANLCCSPLSCPVSTAFSLLSSHQQPLLVSCHQLSSLQSSHQLSLSWAPATNSTLLTSHQLPTASLWVASSTLIRLPVPLPGTARFSCPRILCLVSRQNRLVCFGGQPP